MAQATGNMPNTTFPVFRSNLNDEIEAILTMHSGPSDPVNPKENMLIVNTAEGVIKQRSEDNLSWIQVGTLGQPGWIRSNAGNPNGLITGNYPGQLLFDTSNSKYYFSHSGTVWGGLSALAPLAMSKYSARYLLPDEIKIQPIVARDVDDSFDILNLTGSVLDITSVGAGGRDYATAIVSGFHYIYLIADSTGVNSPNVIVSQADEGNTNLSQNIALPAGYDKKRQLPSFLLVDGSGNVTPFSQSGSKYRYEIGQTNLINSSVLQTRLSTNFNQAAFSIIDASSFLPDMVTTGIVSGYFTAGTFIVKGPLTGGQGAQIQAQSSNRDLVVPLNNSKQFEARVDNKAFSINIDLIGGYITRVQ